MNSAILSHHTPPVRKVVGPLLRREGGPLRQLRARGGGERLGGPTTKKYFVSTLVSFKNMFFLLLPLSTGDFMKKVPSATASFIKHYRNPVYKCNGLR